MNKNRKNPWKALSSYEINDECVFCGRDTAIEELSSLIEYNQIVTLYGKSGMGKTSLLQAGVFPILKLNNFEPKVIRLGELIDDNIPYSKIILDSIGAKDIAEDYLSTNLFCDVFKKHVIQNKYNEQQIPVIILDQFEEILLRTSEKTQALLLQIAEWLNCRDAVTTDCHFVISIREDDLYLLEDSIDSLRINSLRAARYRLRSLSENEAKEIIKIPCERNNITINDDAINKILDLSTGKHNEYEPSALSLMCYQLYDEVEDNDSLQFNIELISSFGYSSIISYYKNAVTDLSPYEIEYIESELITTDGRRNFVSEDNFKHRIISKKKRDELCKDGKTKILQITNGKVELVHDLLAKAIKEVKDHKSIILERRTAQFRQNITFVTVLSLFGLLYWAGINGFKHIPSDLLTIFTFCVSVLNIVNLIFISPPLISHKSGLKSACIRSALISIVGITISLVADFDIPHIIPLFIVELIISICYLFYAIKINQDEEYENKNS